MLLHDAHLCKEVRHYAKGRGDARQEAKSTITELQTIAHPRVRGLLGNLAEQVDGADTDRLVTLMRKAMAITLLLRRGHPQVVADIYAKHWS
jgi:hypothetical protein